MAERSRESMCKWLWDLLEEDTTPGLSWVDRNQGIFNIPWTHASRRTWRMDDARLFRKWAEYTGKIDKQEKPDPKKWKTNFRCALNSLKRHVRRIQVSNNGSSSVRKYQFIKFPRQRRPSEKRTHTKKKPTVKNVVEEICQPKDCVLPDSTNKDISKPQLGKTSENSLTLDQKMAATDKLIADDNSCERQKMAATHKLMADDNSCERQKMAGVTESKVHYGPTSRYTILVGNDEKTRGLMLSGGTLMVCCPGDTTETTIYSSGTYTGSHCFLPEAKTETSALRPPIENTESAMLHNSIPQADEAMFASTCVFTNSANHEQRQQTDSVLESTSFQTQTCKTKKKDSPNSCLLQNQPGKRSRTTNNSVTTVTQFSQLSSVDAQQVTPSVYTNQIAPTVSSLSTAVHMNDQSSHTVSYPMLSTVTSNLPQVTTSNGDPVVKLPNFCYFKNCRPPVPHMRSSTEAISITCAELKPL